jgi:F420-non-reducing hydrogenase iron-sulfur subunit
MSFEPKILGILCNWCSYTGADLAGTARLKYPANLMSVRVMCSGRVDPGFILGAFRSGADAVLICGCHPGDCHYVEGNYKCMRRIPLTKLLLKGIGIDPKRVRLEWVSASEGNRFQQVVTEYTEQIRALGPFKLSDWAFDPEQSDPSDNGNVAHALENQPVATR